MQRCYVVCCLASYHGLCVVLDSILTVVAVGMLVVVVLETEGGMREIEGCRGCRGGRWGAGVGRGGGGGGGCEVTPGLASNSSTNAASISISIAARIKKHGRPAHRRTRLISKQNNSSSSFVVVVMPELFMFHARARFPLSPTA